MSDQTVRISKERLRYLEYLEANASSIVNNAVFEIIEREKQTKKKCKHRNAASTIYTSSTTSLADSRGILPN
jgi:hypothetical protein